MCCTGSAELYVPAGVSPPPLPAFPSPPPPVFPSPTPIPTPVPPQAGPVPPNARTWKVTVVNRSSQPATLFVAEEDERGPMARLVGSVTPNVVPPGATVQVTFLLPAKGVDGWSIFVNPGPDDGGLVGWTDLSPGGEIHILRAGQPGWLPEDQLPVREVAPRDSAVALARRRVGPTRRGLPPPFVKEVEHEPQVRSHRDGTPRATRRGVL